jgi:hypothetical protein
MNTSAGTTTSTTYTATLTAGGTNPSATVTVPASGKVLVIISGRVDPAASQTAFMSFTATGVTASDAFAIVREHGTSSATGFIQGSATYLLTGLTPGSNTFALAYRGTGGTSTFTNRQIVVIPLP